jgi:hypothetical protein
MFMSRLTWMVCPSLLVLLLVPPPATACILCGGNPKTTVTLRQAARSARLILYGTMFNPRLNPENVGQPGSGTTDFRIEKVLKSDPFIGNTRVIRVQRYIPVDARSPSRFLLFCDVYNNKLDPYRGVPVQSTAILDYVKGAMTLDPKNSTQALLYFFRYLDHKEEDLANDAFIEFSQANDQQIGAVAPRLAPDRLRRLLLNPRTRSERLGLFAFLLGACGTARDADLFRSLLDRPTERTSKAFDGILSGYIQLRPRQGWDLTVSILGDPRKPFADRFAALRTLRFHQAWKPKETRLQVLRGLSVMLNQGDIADMAIEDLRRWQMWDLTTSVLAQYGKKSHSAPILRRAIVRYALSCPKPEAVQFAARLRKKDAELVAEVQESLEFEKVK